MTPREPERTATAEQLAAERAKLERAASGAWREVRAASEHGSEAPATPAFGHRFTIFPDSGVTELHCSTCGTRWAIGYHPSLDVLIEQARAHNESEHAPEDSSHG